MHDNEHDRDLVLMSLSTRQPVNLSTCQPVNGPIGSKVNGSRSRSTRRAMIGWRSQLLSLADDLGELHSMLAFEPGMANSGINMNTPATDIAKSLGLNIGRTSGLEADRKVWENLRAIARQEFDAEGFDYTGTWGRFDEHRKSQVRMKVLRRAKSELSTLDTTKLIDGILDWIMFRLINSVKKRVGRTGPPYPAADQEGLSRERSAPSLSSTEENQGGALPTQNSDGRHPKLDVNFITNPGITDDDTGERA